MFFLVVVFVELHWPPTLFSIPAVRNLPYDITEDEVRNFFLPAGTPSRIAYETLLLIYVIYVLALLG